MPVHAAEVPEPVRFPKAMHVSPFLDLDLDHSFAFTPFGGDRVTVRMDDWRGDRSDLLEQQPVLSRALLAEGAGPSAESNPTITSTQSCAAASGISASTMMPLVP